MTERKFSLNAPTGYLLLGVFLRMTLIVSWCAALRSGFCTLLDAEKAITARYNFKKRQQRAFVIAANGIELPAACEKKSRLPSSALKRVNVSTNPEHRRTHIFWSQ